MVLIGVFAVSALAKLSDRSATAIAARSLGVPERLSGPVSRLLPAAELGIAGALVVGLFVAPIRRLGAAGAIALLGMFTMAMIRTLRRGNAPLCLCFGSLGARPIGTESVIRNAALVALGVVAAAG